MVVTRRTRIEWQFDRETRFPFGRISPDPARWAPIGFPPPWPDRPWVYGVMVSSANGVVAWRRKGAGDDPVLTILGGSESLDRIADRRHMRFLRSFGDASVGAQTVRDQPTLVLTPQEPRDEPAPALYAFRRAHGLPHHPRNIVYSLFGRLPLEHPIFTSPDLEAIVVTTETGAAEIHRREQSRRASTPPGRSDDERSGASRRMQLIIEPLTAADGLRRAHERLFAERGVRYLACEGGETVLTALRRARLLDEVFLTVTDVVVDHAAHDDVLRIMDFEAEGATLIAEGRIASDSGWSFRRWRFSDR